MEKDCIFLVFLTVFSNKKKRKKQAASKKEAGGDAKHVFFFTSPKLLFSTKTADSRGISMQIIQVFTVKCI